MANTIYLYTFTSSTVSTLLIPWQIYSTHYVCDSDWLKQYKHWDQTIKHGKITIRPHSPLEKNVMSESWDNFNLKMFQRDEPLDPGPVFPYNLL